MSPEYYGPPALNSFEAGNDMVIKLVGVNDLSTLSVDNFYNDGYVYAELLG